MERLMQMKTKFATALEYEIVASRDYWSQVVPSRTSEEEDQEDGQRSKVLDLEELLKKLKQ